VERGKGDMSNMKEQKAIQSSEVVSDETGRQYHINLAPGELAEYVILVGDPGRADKASEFLDDIRVAQRNREYVTYTGFYKGMEVSVMSTGIGTDNVEIAMIEIFQITKNPAFIRVGSCGGLKKEMDIGELVISTGAVRLENTSLFFVNEGYPAVADYEVVLALISACDKSNYPYHLGLTASASGFYGAQGRNIPGIPLRFPNLQDDMTKMNVANFEMESSTLFTLASLKGLRASTVCAVYANRIQGTFIDPETKAAAERNCILAGLEGFKVLERMDAEKKKRNIKYWFP